jgi:inositol-1,4,5-trisphosphate 5-phosphatase
MHLGTIDDVPLVEKHKFPLQYFPESRWSRKGYLRTRWRFSIEAVFDLVNIHLFHDASNLKSVESVPSIYVNYRKRALNYTLDRINNLTTASTASRPTTRPEAKPYFIFGDFNFRLDCKSVVKNLTSDLLDITPISATTEMDKQYVDKRSQELVLSIGKKEFALLRGDTTFGGEWRKWTDYDVEATDLRGRLTEFPLAFPPTYPFQVCNYRYKYCSKALPRPLTFCAFLFLL